MKRTLALILMSLLVGLALASSADFALESYQSAFMIRSQNDSAMELDFTLPHYEVFEESVGDQVYHRLFIPDTGTLMEAGMPELPVITTSIAIPYQGSVNIEVLNSTHSVLDGFHAYPLQQGAELESPKSFQMNSQFYHSSQSYPANVLAYSDPMILRDFRIVTIQINPFSFHPSTGELNAYNHVRLKLNFTDTPGPNELAEPVNYISPSFDKIYASYILNYEDYRYIMEANIPPRYLIIHGNTTDTVFHNALNDFVLWKRQKGAEVNVASTASNQAGSSTTSIQTYIRNQYNNPTTRPDFVILIGDTTGSYTIPCFTNNGGASDYPYSHMNTGDLLGDLFIGRISVENITQFKTLLNKIYLYERDINIDTAAWLNRILLVGDNAPSGISTLYINKYVKEMAMEINPNYTFVEQYGSDFNSFVPTINGAFNQGIAFYSFRGYIDYVPPTESSLSNGFRLPHVVAITCGSGNFSGLAESEEIIRYGTEANPKGAVTCIGMATSSTHTSFNNSIHGGTFEGIFARRMRTMGEALLNGKLYTHQIYGVSSPINVEKFSHWSNLMGDPSMEVFTGIPNTFTVSTQDSIPIGLSLLDVEVLDQDGMVVENACVTLSFGPTILCKGFTDHEGKIVLQLPELSTVGTAVLTVSTHNFKPRQKNIQILDWPTLVPAAIIIDDDNNGASQGNDNGIATAGETLEIFFGLYNIGSETISGVSGTASSDSPWIEILQDQISYPAIMGGATGNNLTPIVIQISHATRHKTLLRLQLHLTDDAGNEYNISEFIEVEAADVQFVNLSLQDLGNNNGVLDPGESASLDISVINNGAAVVTNVYARLYTENDLISITDNVAYIGTLGLGTLSHTSPDNNFQVWLRPETLPGMVMPLHVRLYNDDGFEQYVYFSLTVGTVSSTDPLGPDSYGYVIYDWTDTAYPDCAQYSWYEIAPPAGGLGTALAITDVYNSSNEGDQVGAQALAVVNLPFPFQFYGRLYDQITVCSNGFIAMGISENAEFRNYRLPGAMGPSPMIAPFWDDLATHSGSGIYTYFDRNNHSFIVEWYNMKNGYNGSAVETFQVILYDQSVYNTSLGDGPIKFQYHTFNNVDVQSGNRHGNYCTIGIEDHTGTRGLEYTYNNQYPTAAASPLSNGKALYITNVPIYHEAANVMIDQIYLTDDNNVVEPGETVDLGILLQNSGNVAATGLNTIISTTDPFANIINAESAYYDLEPESSGVNRSPFIIEIAPDCPSDYTINFSMEIQSQDQSWDRMFSLRVESHKLQYHSFMVSDFDENFNGIIEPGEIVKLIVNLKNNGVVDARNVEVELSSNATGFQIINPSFTLPLLPANKIMQVVFDLDCSNISDIGEYLPMYFKAIPESGDMLNVNFYVPFNLPNLSNDFELDNGGFVSETGWAWGNPTNAPPFSGTRVWATNLSGHYPNNVIFHLFSPKYTLGENSQMSFMHYYGLEEGYDGVNVAISTNNGQSWQVIEPVGGYTHNSIAVLSNQAGFSGHSGGWLQANFDLSQYANQEVSFRFRFASNGDVSDIGWMIDDFVLNDINLKVGHLSGMIYPTSGANPNTATIYSNQHYGTRVQNDGTFRLYLPNGTHSVTAQMPNHQSSTNNNVQINSANPVLNTDFTLIYMPPVEVINITIDNDTGTLLMFWAEPDPEQLLFPISSYHVYRKFDSGPFVLMQDAPEPSFTETLTLEGEYRFYVTPMHINGEGSPSEVVLITYPYTQNPQEEAPALVTALKGNYPNPFNPTTTISFSLAKADKARLNIYNTKGQLVRQLADQGFDAGQHYLVWDGKDNNKRSVASGLYFYRLETADYTKTRKMVLMK